MTPSPARSPAPATGAPRPRTHSSFTPSLSDRETLEALLVGREDLARGILAGIREGAESGNKHQRLLIGPRGIGKTHLVALICGRVRADPVLASRLRIAWLPEDPYVAGYGTLLALIVRQLLRDESDLGWVEARLAAVLDRDDAAQQESMLERLLLDCLDGRTLLLIAEGLDDLLAALREEGQRKLRGFVQNHGLVTVLATATGPSDTFTDRDKTFYGFFRTNALSPLGADEAATLLARLARHAGDDALAELLGSPLGLARVRAIHALAGGNPRIYTLFFDFLTREALDDLVAPFLALMDALTPHCQARMSRLAPLQRTIVDALRRLRVAAPVKEIARQVMASSQTVSAQLGKLVDLGYVVRADSLGRSNYYELREPLLRLCLDVKDGRIPTVAPLVRFMQTWYSPGEGDRAADSDGTEGSESDDGGRDGQAGRPRDLVGEPASAAARDRRAAEARATDRRDGSLPALRQSLQTEPRRIETWGRLFSALRTQGRIRLLQHVARGAAALMPHQARLQSQLGTAYRDQGDFDGALTCYERALAADPGLDRRGEPATLRQAATLGDLGRHNDALRLLEPSASALARTGDTASGTVATQGFARALAYADTLMWLDRWDEGVAALDRVLAQSAGVSWTGADLEIVSGLARRTHNPQVWRRFVAVWLELLGRHGRLAELGEALVHSLRPLAIAWITEQTARDWLATWRDLAGGIAELALALRLLAAGVAYRASRDPRALLDLPREERGLLEPWLTNLFAAGPDGLDRDLEGLLQTVGQRLLDGQQAPPSGP